jgi:hypothetical protein
MNWPVWIEAISTAVYAVVSIGVGLYIIFVRAWLSKDELIDLDGSGLVWEIKAKVTFTDVLGRSCQQEVGKFCVFSRRVAEFRPLWGGPEKD